MKESALFLAEGFEEIEAITVIDVLRRAEIPVKTVSITPSLQVKGAHGVVVEADTTFETVTADDFDFLILPGGMPGTKHLDENKKLNDWLLAHVGRGGRVAAICAAPSVLGRLGLLKGKKATCYPGFESMLLGADFTAEPRPSAHIEPYRVGSRKAQVNDISGVEKVDVLELKRCPAKLGGDLQVGILQNAHDLL